MRISHLLLIGSILALIGCSNSESLVTPETREFTETVPIVDILDRYETYSEIGLLGAYELHIDPFSETVELIPKRISSIGESFLINGIGFFTVFPCQDCLVIDSISLDNDSNIVLTFTIRHPFEAGDPSLPPSGVNRLDLDVFDVALLVSPMDSSSISFPLTNASINTTSCVGADGYTTELANIIESTDALPYYLVVDDSDTGVSTWNKFAMGTELEFIAIFNPISGNLDFDLFLTMGYGASAIRPQRLVPTYYNPEFNKKAPWKITATPPNGDELPVFGNTWDNLSTTNLYDVTVEVYDWQVGANVDPELTNPTDVYASSEILNVSVEIPGMTSSLPSASAPDDPLATGAPDDPLIFTISMANESRLAEGEYVGLVKVLDGRATGFLPPDGDRDYMINAPDGINMTYHLLPGYETYQIFTATVVSSSQPVGNVVITVNREPELVPEPVYGTGEAFDETAPWTLDWDPVAGAAEYAVYYDNDPGDYSLPGWDESYLMADPQFVDVTTDTTFTVPPSHLPADHYTIGNTYVIRVRTVAGDPSSELDDSEPAFIMTNGWETAPFRAAIVDPELFEGWKAGWERNVYNPSAPFYYYYSCTYDYEAWVCHGIQTGRMCSNFLGRNLGDYPGHYDTLLKQTPTVPNATVRFIDFAFSSISKEPDPRLGGLMLGTCSTQPGPGWTTTKDFEWAQLEDEGDYTGYNNDQDIFAYTLFDDVDTSAPWCFKYLRYDINETGFRIGCDVNATANPDDPYIGFAAGMAAETMAWPYLHADDIAIMIY